MFHIDIDCKCLQDALMMIFGMAIILPMFWYAWKDEAK